MGLISEFCTLPANAGTSGGTMRLILVVQKSRNQLWLLPTTNVRTKGCPLGDTDRNRKQNRKDHLLFLSLPVSFYCSLLSESHSKTFGKQKYTLQSPMKNIVQKSAFGTEKMQCNYQYRRNQEFSFACFLYNQTV